MEKEIRRHFSKIGFAYLAGSIVIYAVQFLAAMVGKKFVPGVMADANGSFIVLMLTMYGISMREMASVCKDGNVHAVYGLAGQQDSGSED